MGPQAARYLLLSAQRPQGQLPIPFGGQGTIQVLLGSLRDERLWAQLAGLQRQTPYCYLLITGELSRAVDGCLAAGERVTGWQWTAVQGALLSAQELGVMVTYAASDADYLPAVQRLAARSHAPTRTIRPARQPRLLSAGEELLAALPGVGPERAQAILSYCASAAWGLEYLTNLESQAHIPGIGRRTQETIRQALGLRPEQALAVVLAPAGNEAPEETPHHDQ